MSAQDEISGPEADWRWRAVLSRDKAADGRFVYGVVTTGVYCRPSCASRGAKRENVRFFDDAAAAERAGLRACKRCGPAPERAAQMVELARFIEANAEERLPLGTLARRVGLTPSAAQRAFLAAFGVSPKAYQDNFRLKALKTRLKMQDSVAGAIFEAGYGSTSRVYENLDSGLGMTPSAYRAGGAGEEIGFGCRALGLGLLMMAATTRGVCFAAFGDTEAELLDQLRAEYPAAQLIPTPASAGAQLDAWMAALTAHLEAAGPRPDLPLDLRGTAFQLSVWRFLQSIPEGQAMSYAEVAAGVGAPKSVRAVASACAQNRVAWLVPCHRVVRSDGGLGGYRWGTARKRALLEAERRGAAGTP